MRCTRDGRPMCQVRDPEGNGPVLYFDPKLYNVLRQVAERRMVCTLELNFNDGGLGGTHVRMDGERLAIALGPTATLQVG